MSEEFLRQATNKVKVSGKVAEVNLAVKDFVDKVTKEPYQAIMGDVTVKVSDEESHTVKYFVKEKTKKGDPNKAYQGLLTFMDKTISIADIANGIAPEGSVPSTVAINNAQIGLNEYKAADGNIVSNLQLSASYAPSEVKNLEKFEPKAEFDIEGIVKSSSLEMKDDEETGRAKLSLYVPLYGGAVIPLELVTSEELGSDGADYVTENFTAKVSINLWGNLVNKHKEITRTKASDFGKSKEETTTIRVRELAITGGTLYEEGVHDKQIFDVKLLKEALANRERKLATIKEQENKPKDDKKKDVGFGAASRKNPPAEKIVDEDLDNLFGED